MCREALPKPSHLHAACFCSLCFVWTNETGRSSEARKMVLQPCYKVVAFFAFVFFAANCLFCSMDLIPLIQGRRIRLRVT